MLALLFMLLRPSIYTEGILAEMVAHGGRIHCWMVVDRPATGTHVVPYPRRPAVKE